MSVDIPSWWRKYDRAEQHLNEFKTAISEFTAGRKHAVTRCVETKKKPREWVYRVKINGAVEPGWCLPVGDSSSMRAPPSITSPWR